MNRYQAFSYEADCLEKIMHHFFLHILMRVCVLKCLLHGSQKVYAEIKFVKDAMTLIFATIEENGNYLFELFTNFYIIFMCHTRNI